MILIKSHNLPPLLSTHYPLTQMRNQRLAQRAEGGGGFRILQVFFPLSTFFAKFRASKGGAPNRPPLNTPLRPYPLFYFINLRDKDLYICLDWRKKTFFFGFILLFFKVDNTFNLIKNFLSSWINISPITLVKCFAYQFIMSSFSQKNIKRFCRQNFDVNYKYFIGGGGGDGNMAGKWGGCIAGV